MAHMIPQYSDEAFVTIITPDEDEYTCPKGRDTADIGDVVVDAEPGWYCRLSAPGYLDCTEWSGPHASLDEARDYISNEYNVDPDTGDALEV